MARHGFQPMSPLSAALTIHLWRTAHAGQDPHQKDEGHGGMHWHKTYYRVFQVSMWQDVLWMADEILATAGYLSTSLPPQPRLKPCLNTPDCVALITDEGPHIRYCRRCRQRREAHAQDVDSLMCEPLVTRQSLARWGVGRDGWFEDEVDL